jgi:hypothetical protein
LIRILQCRERTTKVHPIETGPGIGLATRRNVGMADAGFDRVSGLQGARQFIEAFVLGITECLVIGAFEFDTNREIIAALATAP